jgi:ribosomal protein L18
MSTKLTDTQLVMLSAAARRDDRCLVASHNLKGGAAQKVAAKLVGAGLAKEVKAKPGAPVWWRDEQTGQSYALKLTAAGARAIAIDDTSASDEAREDSGQRMHVAPTDSQIVQQATADVPAADAPSPSAPRGGTKLAQVVELLQRDRGAALGELIAATGWLPHTTRAALTGLRKRGYAVTIDRSDKERGSTYHARLDETIEAGNAAAQRDDPPAICATPKSKKVRREEKPEAQQAA